jgi:hypothetical protein
MTPSGRVEDRVLVTRSMDVDYCIAPSGRGDVHERQAAEVEKRTAWGVDES